jgi:uncharacterized protein YndB with AHSA1/START domain
VREIHDSSSAQLEADAEAVFNLITDIDRLPEWNAAIEKVLATPHDLTPGAKWTVQMHPARLIRWKSVSTLDTIDKDRLIFSYRTVNADGNPSYTLWNWTLTAKGHTAEVLVKWDVFLQTWDRRAIAGPIRRRQLRQEVTASLQALAALTVRADR